jgi:hypothetical protein
MRTARALVLTVALASASGDVLPPMLAAVGLAAEVSTRQGRVRPPSFVGCDRNKLTVFTGKVVALETGRRETRLEMNTDENTTERFTITHPDGDASPAFFVGGRPFSKADWTALQPGGRLRANARASVWVCSNEANPKVDWLAPASRP